jgi:hypothetical protein
MTDPAEALAGRWAPMLLHIMRFDLDRIRAIFIALRRPA